MPSLGGTLNAEIKKYKAAQVCHHLRLGKSNCEDYVSSDNRNRSAKSPAPTANSTRSAKKSHQVQKKFVAVHHFHPEVIQHFVKDKKVKFNDYLPESFVKESGLWQNGYTQINYFPGEYMPNKKTIQPGRVFVPIPSYKYAADNYKLLATWFKLNEIIKSCNDSTYGHSHLSRRGEDEVMAPVDRMQKRSIDDPRSCSEQYVCSQNNWNI